jgi:hypothetical protein
MRGHPDGASPARDARQRAAEPGATVRWRCGRLSVLGDPPGRSLAIIAQRDTGI